MFEGARLKVERANQHICDLEAAFERFVREHPHRPRFTFKHDTGETILDILFDVPLPAEIGLILGDAIHNLRTAIDHAVWELVGMDGGTQDKRLKLPAGETRQSYEGFCKGIKTPRDDTKAFLSALEVFPNGSGRSLYGLNTLDNADKHHIITPVVHATKIDRLVVHHHDGSVMLAMTDTTVTPGDDGRVRLLRIGGDYRFNVDRNLKAAPAIFFGKVGPFPNEPVVPTLVQISYAVAHTIGAFERFVVSRA